MDSQLSRFLQTILYIGTCVCKDIFVFFLNSFMRTFIRTFGPKQTLYLIWVLLSLKCFHFTIVHVTNSTLGPNKSCFKYHEIIKICYSLSFLFFVLAFSFERSHRALNKNRQCNIEKKEPITPQSNELILSFQRPIAISIQTSNHRLKCYPRVH